MKKSPFIYLVACAFAALGFSSCGDGGSVSVEDWPSRPITISCFAAAGGGTDLISRLVAKEMESLLGTKVNVVNRTAGRGAAAVTYVSQAARDGNNWGGFSESLLPGPVLGITDTTSKDWAYFMVAGAPGVISVPTSSPVKSLEELINKAKADPKSIKAGAGLTGGLWHTKLLALENAAGVTLGFTPFPGSQPSQLAALSGEVDCVLTSISEQADLIRGGKLRPLAMVENESYTLEGQPEIPAASSQYPAVADVPVSQFLGFALPADTPAPILEKISAAFYKLMAKPSVAEYAESRDLSLLGFSGEEASKRVSAAESAWCWMLQDLGIAVKSPESFAIPKP